MALFCRSCLGGRGPLSDANLTSPVQPLMLPSDPLQTWPTLVMAEDHLMPPYAGVLRLIDFCGRRPTLRYLFGIVHLSGDQPTAMWVGSIGTWSDRAFHLSAARTRTNLNA
jgi:hypothetical protein